MLVNQIKLEEIPEATKILRKIRRRLPPLVAALVAALGPAWPGVVRSDADACNPLRFVLMRCTYHAVPMSNEYAAKGDWAIEVSTPSTQYGTLTWKILF